MPSTGRVAWHDPDDTWGVFLTHSPHGNGEAAFITFGLADTGLPDLASYAGRAAFIDDAMKRGAVNLLTAARKHLVKLGHAPTDGEETLLITSSNRRVRASFHREPFTVHDRTGLLTNHRPQTGLYRVAFIPPPPTRHPRR